MFILLGGAGFAADRKTFNEGFGAGAVAVLDIRHGAPDDIESALGDAGADHECDRHQT